MFPLRPLITSGRITQELGTPLDTFSIIKVSNSIKIGLVEWHKLQVNKSQFSVFQNPWFLPLIQSTNFVRDNNSKLRKLKNLEQSIEKGASYFDKRLSGILFSSMATGDLAVPIAI